MVISEQVVLSAAVTDKQVRTVHHSDVSPQPIADPALEPHAKGWMEGFGDRIRWIRAGTGLSQEALARKIRVSVRSLNAWETEERRPHRSTLESLAKFIDVPISELWAFIDSPAKLRTLPKQMRRWFDSPTVNGSTTLAELVKMMSDGN